jgi:metallophosphoesterase (TIGR00282 family)
VRILFLGDIVGRPGLRAVFCGLSALKRDRRADVVVANAENAADGFGLTPQIVAELRGAGVDVITSGNHVWQRREIIDVLESDPRVLRPLNYPPEVPGRGWCGLEARGGSVAIVNLEGRKGLSPLCCPLEAGRRIAGRLREVHPVILVDFHAEANDEKEALAFHLDGLVSAVVGSHTHVQTADERILPGGTGLICDAGMCGSADGIIGMEVGLSVRRYLTQLPLKMEVDDGEGSLCGVLVEADSSSGRCLGLERVVR